MTRALAVIYGRDGFDLDVVANLRGLYGSLGYRVIASRDLIAADLLVVHRPPNLRLDLSDYRAVHVYDYVGTPVAQFAPSLQDVGIAMVVAASKELARAWEVATPGGAALHIEVSPVPVMTRLWAHQLRRAARALPVHVGNFKASYRDPDEPYSGWLRELVAAGELDVWGEGWEDHADQPRVHGRARLSRVSRIYASSTAAAGMMYPFQRPVTYSGRFWHAPLNGALLVSEPGKYAGDFPGVEVTHSLDEFRRSLAQRRSYSARSSLQELAVQHWDVVTARLAAKLPPPAAASQSDRATRPFVKAVVVDQLRRMKNGR